VPGKFLSLATDPWHDRPAMLEKPRNPPAGRFATLFGGIWLAVGSILVVVGYVAWRNATPDGVGEESFANAWGLLSVGLLFALSGGLILVLGLRRRAAYLRLVREGVPIEATVTAVEPTHFKIQKVTQWRVRYQYVDYGGHIHQGKSALLSPEAAHTYAVGQAVTARYDRERPTLSVLD